VGERRGIYRVLVGKSEGKGPHGRPRRIWEDNIKMDIQEIWCKEWTGSSWLRIGTGSGICECDNKPSGYINAGYFLTS
jgi:hypothetical protein